MSKEIDDRAIMVRSFRHTLDLVDLLLSGSFDLAGTDRARGIVTRFREMLDRSDAAHAKALHQQTEIKER